ncbi:COX15-CtaA-domain-containing protein [Clavulina sp. PMI_390]|nr:COX15-CtaA-domain-containing protein [Clavulina sp. PMI_390]
MASLLPRGVRVASLKTCLKGLPTRNVRFLSIPRQTSTHFPSTPILPSLWRTQRAQQNIWRTASTLVTPLRHTSNFFTSATNPAALASAAQSLPNSPASTHTTSDSASDLPPVSGPAVTRWLFLSAGLVFAIVVVGGVTRLTESGLSIVEWRPITGTLPPLSQAEWEAEFDKYKTSPEFKTMNHSITLEEFKRIFFWEYLHRLLGRVIGLGFVVPLTYFALRRNRLTPGSLPFYSFLALLIGGQGALGWYMVKSGLRDEIITNKEVARVSQYRLAAHLSMALALYVGMLSAAFSTRNDWRWKTQGSWSKLTGAEPWKKILENPAVRRFKGAAMALSCLVFLTAFSGAFVAGLDAGLIYNEFPMMGEHIIPPISELLSPFYSRASDQSDLWWRNIFENPTTVQFDHRLMGTTTYTATTLLYLSTLLHPTLRATLPPLTRHLAMSAFLMANIQVALGISTLLYLVPVPLAAAHQGGSVLLLTTMVALMASLRAPGRAARLWRAATVGKRTSERTQSAQSFTSLR